MAMKERKEDRRMRKAEVISDIISWIPELLFLPIRLVIWLLRGLVSLVKGVLGNW
ncbi:hypothetical protein MST22_09940 [Virgibacillus halodenitrificans]|uniref:Uncharacterized protein n=1 Tax=Virgibacillus halodenitrificans TaxID=1482 RepID=A0ABR7VL18_VIRHA|nr:hypothetical protein [Virgibacillus halodenitrificans]MBD1222416.1 hypothetical protein [Virgibacillus halodenitrificans]MCJ0931477.1 hypothetical protein [Virgibacillus halodenitrificans]